MRIVLAVLVLLVGCRACNDLGEPINRDCGNDVVEGREVCDGNALHGQSCVSQGFAGGSLGCADGCGGFVFARCEGIRNPLDPCTFCAPLDECRDGQCIPACAGEPFDTDRDDLGFDITTVRVYGVITRDGAPLDVDESELVLTGDVWWDPLHIAVAADGSFDAAIEPGAYTVEWEPQGPVASQRLADVMIDADIELNLVLTAWSELRLPVSVPGPGTVGSLIYEHLDPHFGRVKAPVGEDHAVRLVPGRYRIWWEHVDGEFPAVEYLEQTDDVELLARSAIEIPRVERAFRLLFNGAPIHSTGGARLEIIRREDIPRPAWNSVNRDRESWLLDDDGRASGWLLERPRDAAIVVNGPPWWGWIWVERDVDLAATDIEYSLSAPRVSGEVRRNGGRLPNASFDDLPRGRLELTSEDSGYVSLELGARGRGDFEVFLPRGTWELRIAGNLWSNVLPLVPWKVPTPIAVQADVDDLEVDVPAVRMAGQLTVNNERPADEPDLETRGSLELCGEGDPACYSVPIAPRGPAGWDVVLAPGKYDAQIVRWWFAADEDRAPAGALPLGRWPVGVVDVSAPTRRDVDVRLVDFTVRIEEDGAPARPGLLWFEDLRTARVAREVEVVDGPVTVTLYPGYYRLMWEPSDTQGLPSTPVTLETVLSVDRPAERTWDVSHVTLAGRVSVNGAVADDADTNLSFARQPLANGTISAPLPSSGPARFEVELVHGYYDVFVAGTPGHPTLPGHGVAVYRPCSDETLD